MTNWIIAAKQHDIAPGESLTFNYEQHSLLIVNLDGEFFAIENNCPHNQLPLEGGDIEEGEIYCPHHGASFCIRSGKVKAPPAYEGIKIFPLKIEQDNILVQL